jgi:hypothetical protein
MCGSNPFLGAAQARHVVLMPLSCCVAARGDALARLQQFSAMRAVVKKLLIEIIPA